MPYLAVPTGSLPGPEDSLGLGSSHVVDEFSRTTSMETFRLGRLASAVDSPAVTGGLAAPDSFPVSLPDGLGLLMHSRAHAAFSSFNYVTS